MVEERKGGKREESNNEVPAQEQVIEEAVETKVEDYTIPVGGMRLELIDKVDDWEKRMLEYNYSAR